jgi:small subunit ribosomal protein S9
MVIIKKKVKSKAVEEEKKIETPKEKYFFAVGRRKTAVARAKLTPSVKEDVIAINGRKINDYFPGASLQNVFIAPLKATGITGKFKVNVIIRGGGLNAQAEAGRLALARTLVIFNQEFKKPLRDLGFLTRDARIVERKKAGLKKARKAPQWAKR